jgi:dipeptidyl aminopeptidase/acylaminoacyl peptidase
MTTEKISWKKDGLKIAGEVYLPTPGKPPFPALIVCHGIPGKNKGPDDGGYPALAERFCGQGWWVLIFNFRGAGESEGNFDLGGWARDLEGALDFSAHRAEVDRSRLFLMGFSAGGSVSIYGAAHRPEVAGVVSCAAPAHFQDILSSAAVHDFLARCREVGIIRDLNFPPSVEEWAKSFRAIEPLRFVEKIPPRPFLILHGTRDDVVPVEHAHRLYEKVKGKADLILVEGAGHRLRVEEKAMAKAEKWLLKTMIGDR